MPYNRPKKVIASVGGSSRGAGGAIVIVSDTEPTTRDDGSQLKQGDFWWEESEAILHIYINGKWEVAGNTNQATFITLSWSSTAISANGGLVDDVIDAQLVVGDSSTDASADIADTVVTTWEFDLLNDGDYRAIDLLTDDEKEALGLIETTRADKSYYELNGPLNGVDGYITYPDAKSRVTVRAGHNDEFEVRGTAMPVWVNAVYENPVCEGPGCGYNGQSFTTHNLKLQSPTTTKLAAASTRQDLPDGYPSIENRETQEDANIYFVEALGFQLELIQDLQANGGGGGGGNINFTAVPPMVVDVQGNDVEHSFDISTLDSITRANPLLNRRRTRSVSTLNNFVRSGGLNFTALAPIRVNTVGDDVEHEFMISDLNSL